MATEWGGTERNLRVGINAELEVNTATYQRVKFYFYADPEPDGWGWNDDLAMRITGSAGSSTVNFHKGAQNSQLVATRTVTRNKGSNPINITVSCSISGAFNGATPSHSRTHTVPARSDNPDPPSPPGAGSLDVIDRWEDGATLRCGASMDPNGAPVTLFHMQVASGPSFDGNVVFSEVQEGRTWVVGGLSPGSRYWFRARCGNSAGWGAWSGSNWFDTRITTPGVIGGRTTTGIFGTVAFLDWDPPTNGGDPLIEYEIRIRKQGTVSSDEFFVWAQDQSHYSASGLSPGTPYEWVVRARNGAGWGPYQVGWETFTTDDLPPGAPDRPTMQSITSTSATVRWIEPDPRGSTITGYDVQRSTNSSFSGATLTNIANPAVSGLGMGSLSPATRYYVRVRATSDEGNGLWSPARSFATSGLSDPYPVIKYWNGTAWVRLDPVNIWDGTDFVEISSIKYWNGTAWADISHLPY